MKKNQIHLNNDEVNLLDFLSGLYKQKTLIILITALVTVAAYIYASSIPVHYQIVSLINEPYKQEVSFVQIKSIESSLSESKEVDESDSFESSLSESKEVDDLDINMFDIYSQALYRFQSSNYHSQIFDESNFIDQINSTMTKESFLEKISFESLHDKDSSSRKSEKVLEVPYGLKANDVLGENIDLYKKFSKLIIDNVRESTSNQIQSNLKLKLLTKQKQIQDLYDRIESTFEINKVESQELHKIRENIKLHRIDNEIFDKVNLNDVQKNKALSRINDQVYKANKLGIKDNSSKLFEYLSPINENSNESSPLFYLYEESPLFYMIGEKALILEAEVAKNPFDEQLKIDLLALEQQKKSILLDRKVFDYQLREKELIKNRKLSNLIDQMTVLKAQLPVVESLNIESFQVVQYPTEVYEGNRSNLIILTGFFAGFFLSLIVALLKNQSERIRQKINQI